MGGSLSTLNLSTRLYTEVVWYEDKKKKKKEKELIFAGLSYTHSFGKSQLTTYSLPAPKQQNDVGEKTHSSVWFN